MRKLPLIVTGTGQCATAFYAKFLTSAGIPTGHEAFFRPFDKHKERLERVWKHLIADCSWLAAPYLHIPQLEDALLVHLIRHPKGYIESCHRLTPWQSPEYTSFAQRHCKELQQYNTTVNYAAAKYVYWNEMIERAPQQKRILFHIEEEPNTLLYHMMDYCFFSDAEDLFDDRTFNCHHGKHVEIGLDDITDKFIRAKLEIISERYGYEW